MSVSFPPPPTQRTTTSSEDDAIEENPTNMKGSSETPGPMFDGFMKLYAILSFTIFVAIVFAREAIDSDLG